MCFRPLGHKQVTADLWMCIVYMCQPQFLYFCRKRYTSIGFTCLESSLPETERAEHGPEQGHVCDLETQPGRESGRLWVKEVR